MCFLFEPNEYLHIDHTKSIMVNFDLTTLDPADHCNLRFDNTNPSAEKIKYTKTIKHDLH